MVRYDAHTVINSPDLLAETRRAAVSKLPHSMTMVSVTSDGDVCARCCSGLNHHEWQHVCGCSDQCITLDQARWTAFELGSTVWAVAETMLKCDHSKRGHVDCWPVSGRLVVHAWLYEARESCVAGMHGKRSRWRTSKLPTLVGVCR